MMDRIKINQLLDIYGNLLTDKQKDICNYYYRQDLSLQEISELEGISRSAVHDMIKRVKNELIRYEQALNCFEKSNKRKQIYKQMEEENDSLHQYIQKLKETEEGSYE